MGVVLGVLGGPLGGIFALGAGILLQYLFPQKVEGPRQEDTRVSTAKYGDPIGRVLGTARIAGNIVWLQGDKITETKKTYRQGKGGPVVTEYSYHSTSAYVFDYDGPAEGIIRAWIDDELVYDNSADARDQWLAQTGKGFGTADGVTFTFYLGTVDQLPDSRIVSDKGADYVSGWRNLVYVVMSGLNHEEIGIRMPNLEVEICKELSGSDPDGAGAWEWDSYRLTNFAYPSGFSLEIAYANRTLTFYPKVGTGGIETLYIHNLLTGAYEGSFDIPFPAYGIDGGIAMRGSTDDWMGYIWSRTGELYRYDQAQGGTDLDATYLYDHSDLTINNTPYSIIRGSRLAGFMGDKIDILDLETMTLESIVDTTLGSLNTTVGFTANSDLSKFYIISNFTIDISNGASCTNYNLNTLYSTGILGQVWAVESGGCIVRAANGFYRINDDGTLATSRLAHGLATRFQFGNVVGPTSDNELWYAVYNAGVLTYYRMDCETLEVLESTIADVLQPADLTVIAFIEDYNVFVRVSSSSPKTYVDHLPAIRRGGIDAGAVIVDLVELIGMPVDVTGVGKFMKGYAIKGDITWRAVIDDITRVLGIDHCQIDGVYTFFDRGSVSAATIDASHIGAALKDMDFPQDNVKEVLGDDLDRPNAVTFTYPSFDASYRQGSQRVDLPLDSTHSLNEMSVSTSVVLSDDQAAKAADVLLRESREVPDIYEFTLPPYYANLHSGVVITVPLDGGAFAKMVIEEIEDDILLRVKAHKRTIDYLSDAVGVTTPDPTRSRITDATVYFLPIDSNMLRNNVDDNTDGFYMLSYWRGTLPPSGVNVWRSLDNGGSYDPWATFVSFATVSKLVGTLGEESSPYIPHEDATFTFIMKSAGNPPDSVSYSEWLDGQLACLIQTTTGEWEVVLVETITDNGDGTYEASGLVRGYGGTETLTGLHASGNLIVWLDVDYIARTPRGDVGIDQRMVAVVSGREFDADNAQTFSCIANSLKPFRPVGISGTRDSGATETLTVSWTRQSRYDYAWEDGTEDVPLNEDAEEYEIEYYLGASLLRTRMGLSSPTDDYTLAEYNIDAGTSALVIPTLNVMVYQVSQDLTVDGGRGYPGEATI